MQKGNGLPGFLLLDSPPLVEALASCSLQNLLESTHMDFEPYYMNFSTIAKTSYVLIRSPAIVFASAPKEVRSLK